MLWATAARGGFGIDGLALVVKRLQSVAQPSDADKQQIAIRPDGPDQLQLGQAVTAIESSAGPLSPRQLAVPGALAGIGLVLAVGLAFVHPIWIVAGLVLIGIGGFRYWTLRSQNAGDRAAAADHAGRLRERCNEAAGRLSAYSEASADRQAAVANDLTELRRLLTA